MSAPIVIIERIKPTDEHDRQKFYRLRGRVEGSPESTWKTATIAVAALVQKPALLDGAKEKLAKDVAEYYDNYLALEQLEKR